MAAWHYFSEEIWFGHGPTVFYQTAFQFAIVNGASIFTDPNHPHSVLPHGAVSFGIPGIIILIGLVIRLTEPRLYQKDTYPYAAASLIGALIPMSISYHLWADTSVVLLMTAPLCFKMSVLPISLTWYHLRV